MEIHPVAQRLVGCKCLMTPAITIISWGEGKRGATLRPPSFKPDPAVGTRTVVTVAIVDGRKANPEESRLPGYCSALRRVEPTLEWEYGEKAGENRGPVLRASPSRTRRQKCSSSETITIMN